MNTAYQRNRANRPIQNERDNQLTTSVLWELVKRLEEKVEELNQAQGNPTTANPAPLQNNSELMPEKGNSVPTRLTDGWISATEAATLLGVCKRTLFNNNAKQHIRRKKRFGKLTFWRKDIDNLLAGPQ